jgi:FkbM family methyltransferase
MVKSFITKLIARSGYTFYKTSYAGESPASMGAALKRLKALGFSPNTVIDVGAAQGTWTEKALTVWPNAHYHLVEPLSEQVAFVKPLQEKHPNIGVHLAVAGEASGEVALTVSPDLDGSGVYGGAVEGNIRMVPVITIDEIAKGAGDPVFMKFDTHGYEIPILKGAGETLKRTGALVIEVYGFRLSPTCLLFHELSAYLDTLGFRLFDIVDIMRRPGDEAFWQADAFYLRKDHPVFQRNSYA